MKADNNHDKKEFSKKDIIIIVLCIVALIVLVFILKKSQEAEQMEQQQLSDIQEQIQNNGSNSVDSSSKAVSYEGIVFNEINENGWIELYNSSKEETNLKGLSLNVNGEVVKEFSQEQIVGAGELFVIETDAQLGTEEHNVIALEDAEGSNVCAMIVPILSVGESYGCVENGNIEIAYQTASKGIDNEKSNILTKNELTFSIPGGFYQNTIMLEINAPKDMKVYYTLDGSEPTTESNEYEGAIKIVNRSGSNYEYASAEMSAYTPSSIYMGTVVRAIAVDGKGNVQQTETESYFIGLANNSDMYNIPVISITTNPENLFDYFEGMYVPGRSKEDAIAMNEDSDNVGNYWNGWVKEAHIEYYESNKDKTFEGNVNLSMLQDYSIESHQKGFKVSGVDEGAWKGSSLSYFFNEASNSLLIQTNKRDNTSKLREYLANELLKDTEVGTSEATPCIIFIDGEYWGAYMLRENHDEAYIRNQYNITDNVEVLIEKNDIFNDWDHHQLYDEFYYFMTTTDMSVQANYEKAKQLMDVQSYLDYFCANVYLANADYGIDEGSMWRTVSSGEEYEDGRWRWTVGKLDNTMNNTVESKRTTSSIDSYKMPEIAADKIFRSLIRNKEFREQLQTTMNRMAEQIFEVSHVEEVLEEIIDKTEKMSLTSYQRFFGNATEKTYDKEVEDIKKFFENRAEYIDVYTQEVMSMNGKWYQFTESVEEESVINGQESITEPNEQSTAETNTDGVS